MRCVVERERQVALICAYRHMKHKEHSLLLLLVCACVATSSHAWGSKKPVSEDAPLLCFVVRTFWGHGAQYGDDSLHILLESFRNQTVGRCACGGVLVGVCHWSCVQLESCASSCLHACFCHQTRFPSTRTHITGGRPTSSCWMTGRSQIFRTWWHGSRTSGSGSLRSG